MTIVFKLKPGETKTIEFVKQEQEENFGFLVDYVCPTCGGNKFALGQMLTRIVNDPRGEFIADYAICLNCERLTEIEKLRMVDLYQEREEEILERQWALEHEDEDYVDNEDFK